MILERLSDATRKELETLTLEELLQLRRELLSEGSESKATTPEIEEGA